MLQLFEQRKTFLPNYKYHYSCVSLLRISDGRNLKLCEQPSARGRASNFTVNTDDNQPLLVLDIRKCLPLLRRSQTSVTVYSSIGSYENRRTRRRIEETTCPPLFKI